MGHRNISSAGGLTSVFSMLVLAACGPGEAPVAPADLVFVHGKVITVDRHDRIAEALAVDGGKIVAIGDSDEVTRYVGPQTRVVELRGNAVTPGLIDTHNHFAWGAADALFWLDLVYPAVASIEDIVAAVGRAVLEKDAGDWILGNGWDQGKLAEGRNLRATDLDAVSPGNPVWLGHTSGHYGVANSAALALANIKRATPDPEGGWIERDEDGEPTGILADRAQDLMYAVVPEYTAEMLAEAVIAMAPKLNAEGITTIKDPEINDVRWQAYQRARDEEKLPVRVFGLWRAPDTLAGAEIVLEKIAAVTGPGDLAHDDRLVSGGVKIYVDGSGTVRTAWMYDDWNEQLTGQDAGNRGFPVVDPDVLEAQMRLFHEAGVHLGTHAIGDRAIDFTVDTYDRLLEETPNSGLRHSIIHCNIPSDHAMDVMARLQRDYDTAYPETQPGFTWWIADAYAANFGVARNARMIPLRSYLERGIKWASSSDFNVTPFAPRYGIWASVAREALLGTWGRQPFGSDEAVSVQVALKSYTRWNARQVFMEDKIGSLEIGKYADLVVWDRDPYAATEAQLRDMQVNLTVLGGKVVYERTAQ